MTRPTSKNPRPALFALLLMAAGAMMTPAVRAADSEAWAVYQEFIAACETATSVEQLLPLLAQWRHERYEASDKAARSEMLARLCKEAKDLKDMVFVSEDAKGGSTVLQLKASWEGQPMKGKVTIAREDAGLKVDEWFWATGE